MGSGANGRSGKGDGGHADEEVCHRVLWSIKERDAAAPQKHNNQLVYGCGALGELHRSN